MQRKIVLFGIVILTFSLALAFFSPSIHTTTAQGDQNQAHKDAVKRIVEEGFNQGKVDVLDEVLADNYISYAAGGNGTEDKAAFKDDIQAFRAAMPDLHATADPVIADGDWVAIRFTMTGTFQNPLTFTGQTPIPPTGKPIKFSSNILMHFDQNGKIFEEYDESDNLSFLAQLGVLNDMLGGAQGTQAAPQNAPSVG